MNTIKSILLVDDDQDDQFFFASALNQVTENVELFAACNGVDALDKLRFRQPDLILLDLVMPRMNGIIFLKMIKRNRNLAHIPVFIYTSDLSIFQEKELMDAGAERIIIKPMTLEKTIELIPGILDRDHILKSA